MTRNPDQAWADAHNARVAAQHGRRLNLLNRTEAAEDLDARRLAADAVELENELDLFIEAEAKRRGWVAVRSRKDRRTTRKRGESDWSIYADHGRKILIEGKRRGEKEKPDQIVFRIQLERLGHTVHVCWSRAQVLEVFDGSD